MLDPSIPVEIPKKADEKYAMVSSMVYCLWKKSNDLEETSRRVDGFLRICKEFSSDFATMAIYSAYSTPDFTVKSFRTKMLYHSKYWNEWLATHKAAFKQYMSNMSQSI